MQHRHEDKHIVHVGDENGSINGEHRQQHRHDVYVENGTTISDAHGHLHGQSVLEGNETELRQGVGVQLGHQPGHVVQALKHGTTRVRSSVATGGIIHRVNTASRHLSRHDVAIGFDDANDKHGHGHGQGVHTYKHRHAVISRQNLATLARCKVAVHSETEITMLQGNFRDLRSRRKPKLQTSKYQLN